MADTVVSKVFRNSGGTREFFIDHVGPSSYVQISGAGDTLSLGYDLSNKGILLITPSSSDDGVYVVYPKPPANSGTPKASGWKLKWVTQSTGAEVAATTDLSARHVRLLVVSL